MMVNFWIYDVSFLILFSIFVVWFLSSRKKDLSRDGIVFMYRTKFGIKAINYIGDKFKKTLYSLRYFIIGLGFALMGVMLWMLGQTVSLYLMHPEITKLRFDKERSNLEDMPTYIRKPLFDIFAQYADGAIKRVDKKWTEIEVNNEFLNQSKYKLDEK